MNAESTSSTPGNRPPPVRRFFFIIGSMGIFSGLLLACNAFDFRGPRDSVVGVGEVLVGGLMACLACRLRSDLVWLFRTVLFQLAALVAIVGAIRVCRLAFGAPWALFSREALLPVALTVLGGLGLRLAYRFLRAGKNTQSMF